jgi:hypothetical protein
MLTKQTRMTIAASAMLAGVSFPVAAQLQAAAGKVDITPERPCWIAGYGSNRRSAGVHDPLWARCLVLKNGAETVALVSCDLIGVARSHIVKIRPLIRKVPAERVLIGATHTHSGPDTYGQWGPNAATSGVDKVWMQQVHRRIAALVDETAGRLQPAVVKFASTKDITRCSMNARVEKILDTELSAAQFMKPDGSTIATLINYACHPEVLNNRQITSDFPHWLRQKVEGALGGTAIYMNGAQGGMITAVIENESSFPKGEAWSEAERIGNTLGEKSLEILAKAKPEADPRLTFSQRIFRVPLENEGFKALMKIGVLEGIGLENGNVVTEVSRFTVGSAEFITLPGEVLPNIGLYLKRHMSGKTKFQLGLTGDALGYILCREDFGLPLYRYETSVSVGSEMGERMSRNLMEMIRAGRLGPKVSGLVQKSGRP